MRSHNRVKKKKYRISVPRGTRKKTKSGAEGKKRGKRAQRWMKPAGVFSETPAPRTISAVKGEGTARKQAART